MNNYISATIYVVSGAVAGSLTTYFVLKTRIERKIRARYDNDVQELAQQFRELMRLNRKAEEEKPEEKKEEPEAPKAGVMLDYSAMYPSSKKEEVKEEVNATEPEMPKRVRQVPYDDISGIDPGEIHAYTYYANGVLTDGDTDEPVDNGEIDNVFGIETLNDIYKYRLDDVYFWNEDLQKYYQICLEYRDYGAK